MSDCTVQFYCPPMAIRRAPDMGLRFHRTDAEPMRCTVTLEERKFPGGSPFASTGSYETDYVEVKKSEFVISPVTIPPTITRPDPHLPLVWWVDACVGEGSDAVNKYFCEDCGRDITTLVDPLARRFGGCECGSFKARCEEGVGNRIRCELPRERVAFKWWSQHDKSWHTFRHPNLIHAIEFKLPFALIAEAIDAPVTLWLEDGRIFKGSVRFEDVKIDNPLFAPVAEATTTTGGELVQITA